MPIIDDLVDNGLLIADAGRDTDPYRTLIRNGTTPPPIGLAYLMPAGDCNLRCRYCFVETPARGNHAHSLMTTDTAEKALQVFAKLTRGAENINLIFYGGEPLLNKQIVRLVMDRVRTMERVGTFERPVEMTLITNGTLIDRAIVEAMLRTGTKVAISIDGPHDLHDAARKEAGGRGSFAKAKRAYNLLQSSGLTPGISCTLNAHNIDHIDEIVDFVAELKPAGLGFNVLVPFECGGNPLDVDPVHATMQMLKAFGSLRQLGIYEDRIMRRVKPFTKQQVHLKDCMGVGGQIVVTPEGLVGPCQAFYGISDYFPFHVDQLHAGLDNLNAAALYRNPLFSEWLCRFPLNMKACLGCAAIGVCGGGCPYAAQANRGSIWEIDERVCSQAKTTLEWMIWDTFDNMNATSGGAHANRRGAAPASCSEQVAQLP
jgi:uncharacterized protein